MKKEENSFSPVIRLWHHPGEISFHPKGPIIEAVVHVTEIHRAPNFPCSRHIDKTASLMRIVSHDAEVDHHHNFLFTVHLSVLFAFHCPHFSLPMLLTFILCSELDQSLSMQQLCMHKLISRMYHFVQAFDEPIDDACQWSGVTCTDGTVTAIDWKHHTTEPRGPKNFMRHIDISWIPPTVQTALFEGQKATQRFCMRSLPQRLVDGGFMRCQLKGSADLESLPAFIENLNLSENELTGTISLCRLPRGLRTIFLHGNWISAVEGYADCLPAGLVHVTAWAAGRQARPVHYVSRDSTRMDDRIHLQKFTYHKRYVDG